MTNQPTNPITMRLTRDSKPPSLRLAVMLAVGIGLALTAYLLWETLHLRYPSRGGFADYPAGFWLMLVGISLTVLAPLITAVVAASGTVRDIRTNDFQLVLISPIERDRILQGYIEVALHRCRGIRALTVALWPAIMLGYIQLDLIVRVVFFNRLVTPSVGGPNGPLDSGLTMGVMALSLWLAVVLAPVAGVSLAILSRSSAWSANAAVVASLVEMASLMAAGYVLINLLTFNWRTLIYAWSANNGSLLLLPAILANIGILWGLPRLARRGLERPEVFPAPEG